jgi:predicted NBD/HSP70 family sugar kinase
MAVLDTVVARAAEGDEPTIAAIVEIGRWLGLGIGNLVNIFNPQLVVVGGFYQRLFPHLQAAVVKSAGLRALEAPGQMASIIASSLGFDAPLIGAGELALAGVMADPAGVGGLAMKGQKSTGSPARA